MFRFLLKRNSSLIQWFPGVETKELKDQEAGDGKTGSGHLKKKGFKVLMHQEGSGFEYSG